MRRLGVLLGTVVVVLVSAPAPGAAMPGAAMAASSGSFSKAVATEDWMHGSFAATVNASPCGSGYCSYFAIVFAQPSLPEYNCHSEEFAESDRNQREVWKGPVETANTTLEASATEVSILSGVYGQRYCLELIGEREVPDRICEAERSVFPELLCPPIKVTFGEYAAGALMTVEAPAPPPVESTSPSVAMPTPGPSTAQATCTQGAAAVTRAWRRVSKAKKALRRARGQQARHRKRQIWRRDKREALQTEKQQHELCG